MGHGRNLLILNNHGHRWIVSCHVAIVRVVGSIRCTRTCAGATTTTITNQQKEK